MSEFEWDHIYLHVQERDSVTKVINRLTESDKIPSGLTKIWNFVCNLIILSDSVLCSFSKFQELWRVPINSDVNTLYFAIGQVFIVLLMLHLFSEAVRNTVKIRIPKQFAVITLSS